MKKYIQKLLKNQDLSRKETYEMFADMTNASSEQKAALMALFLVKKEATSEILGGRDFLRENAVKIDYPFDTVELVGTGGDGIGTFNISTTASIVVASCGAVVPKHGGGAITGALGSADLMQQLGISENATADDVIRELKEKNFAFLRAPVFSKVLEHHGMMRKALGFPSIFNILGPLSNPVAPKHKVMGVYRLDLVRKVAEALNDIGNVHSLVVHSQDGLDEISISAPTHVAEIKNGQITEYIISPEDFGLRTSNIGYIISSNPSENINITLDILSGKKTGPQFDIVLLNSAAGLMVAGIVKNLSDGIELARTTIQQQKTWEFFKKLVEKK